MRELFFGIYEFFKFHYRIMKLTVDAFITSFETEIFHILFNLVFICYRNKVHEIINALPLTYSKQRKPCC